MGCRARRCYLFAAGDERTSTRAQTSLRPGHALAPYLAPFPSHERCSRGTGSVLHAKTTTKKVVQHSAQGSPSHLPWR